ncbi:MAG TPA: TolC family protein [Polyangia bacterium]|nr:TolC family protein [Polyangia bacterium]
MKRAALLMLVIIIGGSGCSVPRQAGFDEVARQLAAHTDYRVHWKTGGDEDRAVADETRRLLSRELTLETATQIALFGNPELQATYERLGVAQADVVQAGLLRNPHISLHYGFNVFGGGVDEILGSVTGAFLDLFLMPLKKKLAQAELARVQLEVGDAVLQKAHQVAQAFYAVQAATQLVAMRRTLLEAQAAAAELAQRQHDAGNASDLELAGEQAAYVQARIELGQADAARLGEREKLTRLLGVFGADVEYRVAPSLPELPASEPELGHLERVAIAHRLDLAAAKAELASASQALRLEKGTRAIGGLDVGVNAHRDPDGPVTVGPTLDLELPVFDQKQAEMARLRASLRAAQDRADTIALRVRSEVRDARNRLLATRAAIEDYRRALLPLREKIVALSQAQYNAMLLGVYQLIAAKQSETNTYREYIEMVREYWIARADLEYAIGTRLANIGASTSTSANKGERP